MYLRRSDGCRQRRSFIKPLVAFSVLGVAWLFWVAAYRANGGFMHSVDPTRLRIDVLFTTAAMFVGPLSFGYFWQLGVFVLLGAMGATALLERSRCACRFIAIVSVVSLVPITLFVRATLPFVSYRYGLGIFPLACVVLACAPKLGARLAGSNRALANIGYGLLAAYCIIGIVYLLKATPTTFETQNWRDAVRYVTAHAKRTDAIVLADIWDADPFHYYYRGGAEPITDIKDLPEVVAKAMGQPYVLGRTVWIVSSSFENANPLVAACSQFYLQDAGAEARCLATGLAKRGLRVAKTTEFRRVIVSQAKLDMAPALAEPAFSAPNAR